MLEVGNEGMSFTEQVAHMTMWAIPSTRCVQRSTRLQSGASTLALTDTLQSPLILGNDVRNMTDETLSIIANAGILAINQDSGTSKDRKSVV